MELARLSPPAPRFTAETRYGVVELPLLDTVAAAAIKAAAVTKENERGWLLLELLSDDQTLSAIDQMPAHYLQTLVSEWEVHSGISVGELFRLHFMIARHGEALEADLINNGLRLRHCPSPEFTWHDLKVFVRYLPVTSNLFGAMFPDRAGWDRQALLMAEAVDSLHWLQWAKTKDGRSGRNRPKPIPRPGVTDPPRDGAKPKPAPLSVVRDRLSRFHNTAPNRGKRLSDLFAGRR